MPVLEVSGLCKTYGDRAAVQGVGFSIAEGETYGLLGPNGAGKTTTISMIVGVTARDAGLVTVDGHEHHPGRVAVKELVGYVPQDLAVYPDLTARENLRFFGTLNGLRRGALRQRVDEILEVIGLTDRATEPVAAFSGGMARRLNIGIGLLSRPRLLVLDEPTAGVDPQSRNAILENVRQLSGEGVAVLYTTHYMEEAERLCDRVGIMDQGRIRAEGTRSELVAMVGEQDRMILEIDGSADRAAALLTPLPAVKHVNSTGSQIELLGENAAQLLPAALDILVTNGMTVRSAQVEQPDLEAVFLHLTGRALRD